MAKIYRANILGDEHQAILRKIRPGSRVLDVGCGTGLLGGYLSQTMGCQVVGIEISEEAASMSRERCLEVIVGDISEESTWGQVNGKLDYIVFADVLEHVVDPWHVLRVAGGFLQDNGSIVVSVPNIAWRKVRLDLLMGRFDYTDSGPLDDTHLRFFTGKSAIRLLERAGFTVADIVPTFKSSRDAFLSRLSTGLFAYHYVLEGYLPPKAL